MVRILFFLQYILYRACIETINAIPFGLALRLANFFGRFFLQFNHRRMEMTRSNLKKAFGSRKTTQEIEEIVHAVNGRLFEIAVEFIRTPKLLKDPERWFPRQNPEIIWDGLKKGKGAILLVSHYGTWEFLPTGGGLEGYPLHGVGKPIQNPFTDRYIQQIREKTGVKTIEKIGSVKDVSALLRQNQAVGIFLDQRVKGGEPVEFLGQTAYFASIAALLAVRYGAPVIPCFVFRRPGPQYFVTATPPMEIKEGEDLRETLHINTQLFAKRIEEEILKTPTEWVLWRHNIWKD